jgi:hypothetical protein
MSIKALLDAGGRVSLSSVVAKSRELDPEGHGISESAILNNAEARGLYESSRTWKGSRRKALMHRTQFTTTIPQIKLTRNVARTRMRYMRLSKVELVERLLHVEQEYAQRHEEWLQANDELLLLKLSKNEQR